MLETWKRLIYNGEDYGDYYLVSDFGRIKNAKTGYIRKNVLDKDTGYYQLYLCFGSRSSHKTIKVHRAVAQTFIPNQNNLPEVNHKDGNKTNNCVINLEWCTAQENAIHAYKNGLTPTGEKSVFSKLTQEDVDYIRANHKPKDKEYGSAALGRKYNVHPSTISKIVHNKNWKWD